MLRQAISRSIPYLWATAAVAAAFALRMALQPVLGDNRPFLTFLAAVALASWLGGRGPAMFAIGLSYFVANWFFIPPLGAFNFDHTNASDWVNVCIFVGLSFVIVEPILAMHRARRRAELGAEQVRQLLAAAKEADRQKDRFLAILSHELRSPLTALSVGLEVWSHRQHDVTEMDRLRVLMRRQVKQITGLVDDLLDVARIARGAIRLQMERVDVGALVALAVDSVRPVVEERGHQLFVELPTDPVCVHGDMVRLNEIVSNILDNAIKYTGHNGTIDVTARRLGDRVELRIGDNGPGICPSVLPIIFEMFSQGGATMDHSVGGLGIGLYLVKHLLDLHGGTIEALSDGPGKGSEFVVSLPVCPAEELPNPVPPKIDGDQGTRAIRPHKIVVVDDVHDSASMLAEILRELGQDVTVATDGATAIESVMTEHPQIVFLDIAMPDMSGYEVAERLRSLPETESVVLIALTGYSRPEDRQRAIEAGFNHHLPKPANFEAVEQLLVSI